MIYRVILQGELIVLKASAIIVGLNAVDPRFYNGWDGRNGCEGCERDVAKMTRIYASRGCDIGILKTAAATRDNILEKLDQAAKAHWPGDFFSFYFSGHGDQAPDQNWDESDGWDETICSFNGPIIDDQLKEIWAKFRPGVRILLISDSCHSGMNFRKAWRIQGKKIGWNKSTPEPTTGSISQIRAEIIHLAACRENSLAQGFEQGGVFTSALCKMWNNGSFKGGYREFHAAITSAITNGQQPQIEVDGLISEKFINQKPFTTTTPKHSSVGKNAKARAPAFLRTSQRVV